LTEIENTINKSKEQYKAGYASIFGRPNVGKSTFLNQVLGFKLSIISPKPQTTRHRILGIHSAENAQIIFLDTPGLLKPRYQLQKAMMRAVEAAIEDANVILYMVEAGEILDSVDREYLLKFKEKNIPILILLNKIDLVQKNKVLPLIEKISKKIKPDAIIPISALKNDGINEVIFEIIKRLPESPPYYPEDLLTEHPERFIVSEIIREKIFYHFGEEIPYSTTVVIDDYKERKGRKVLIRATIITERDSQKGILIGKKGAALKKIGALARVDIEKFLNRDVYLELWVKVREKWRKNEDALREFGYGPKLPRG
jgi:GTPase